MVIVPLTAGAVAAGAGVLAHAVRGRSSRAFGPSVWRGDTRRKAVAITFDDGPSESTPALLDTLRQYGAAATFFQCGANIRRLPDIAREVASCRTRDRQSQRLPSAVLFPRRASSSRTILRAPNRPFRTPSA